MYYLSRLSYFLINTHLAFRNSGIMLEKRVPSRFDDGKYALFALHAHRAHLPPSKLYMEALGIMCLWLAINVLVNQGPHTVWVDSVNELFVNHNQH